MTAVIVSPPAALDDPKAGIMSAQEAIEVTRAERMAASWRGTRLEGLLWAARSLRRDGSGEANQSGVFWACGKMQSSFASIVSSATSRGSAITIAASRLRAKPRMYAALYAALRRLHLRHRTVCQDSRFCVAGRCEGRHRGGSCNPNDDTARSRPKPITTKRDVPDDAV